MILMLIFALILIGVALITHYNAEELFDYIAGTIIFLFIGSVAILTPVLVSYDNAVMIDGTQEGLVAEYRSAVDLYSDKAVLHLDKAAQMQVYPLTDASAHGYQKEMAAMIKELRAVVTQHNQMLVSKRKYRKSLFFSWYTIMPDSDRLIHLVE